MTSLAALQHHTCFLIADTRATADLVYIASAGLTASLPTSATDADGTERAAWKPLSGVALGARHDKLMGNIHGFWRAMLGG